MSSSSPSFPIAEVVCGAVLVAAFAFGIAVPVDPDMDGSFALEAYRGQGWSAFIAAAGALVVVLLSRGVATALERACAAIATPIPRRVRTPLFAVAMGALFVALTDTSLSGDGLGVVHQVCEGRISGSSPLTSVIHVGAVRALPLDPRDVLRFISCAVGVVYAGLAVWAGRVCFETSANRVATTALLVACGSATVFFGSVEIYALPVAGALLFLTLALRRMNGVDERPWPALALGVLVTLHGSTLVLLPALAYVVLTAPGARRTVSGVLPSVLAFVAPIAVAVAALAIPAGAGSDAGIGHGLGNGLGSGLGNVLGAQGQGPLLPLLLSSFNVNHRYAMLDPEHLIGVLNLVLFVAPVGCLLVIAGRERGRSVTLLAIAAASLVGLALVWNVTYPLRRDWDLFATLGIPLALLGALRFLGEAAPSPGRAARVTALCLFAFVPVLITNAGDVRQRRVYADEVVEVYDRLARADLPLSPTEKERVRVERRRWADEARRLDVQSIWERQFALLKARRAGQMDAVDRIAATILTYEPDNVVALLGSAEAALGRGRTDDAAALLERTLRVAREDLRPKARRFLARIELDAGRADAARHHLERGLREEMAWQEEALLLMRDLADLHRAEGRIALAEHIERMAQRREQTGLK